MSLQPITVNSGTIPQPNRLREWREFIQSDKTAVDGGIQRNRISTPSNPQGFKYNVELTYTRLSTAEFGTLDNLFLSGSGVNYYNPASKYGVLSFSGLPYPEEGEYDKGDSLLTSYKVKIRQF